MEPKKDMQYLKDYMQNDFTLPFKLQPLVSYFLREANNRLDLTLYQQETISGGL